MVCYYEHFLFKWAFLKYVFNIFFTSVFASRLFFFSKKLIILLFKISIYLLSVNQIFLFNAIILCVKCHLEFSEPLVGVYVTCAVLLLVNRNVFWYLTENLVQLFLWITSWNVKNCVEQKKVLLLCFFMFIQKSYTIQAC